jgi:hypothetical protein
MMRDRDLKAKVSEFFEMCAKDGNGKMAIYQALQTSGGPSMCAVRNWRNGLGSLGRNVRASLVRALENLGVLKPEGK